MFFQSIGAHQHLYEKVETKSRVAKPGRTDPGFEFCPRCEYISQENAARPLVYETTPLRWPSASSMPNGSTGVNTNTIDELQ